MLLEMEETQAETQVAPANGDVTSTKRSLEDSTDHEPKRAKVEQENGAVTEDASTKAPENEKKDARDLPKGTAPIKAE